MNNLKKLLLIAMMSLTIVSFAKNDTDSIPDKIEISTTESINTTQPDQISVEKTKIESEDGTAPNPNFDIPGKIEDLATSLTWWDFLYILIFTLLGYVSPFIPGLRKIGDTEIRVVVGGVVLIMIFVAMDFNSAIKLVLEFITATKLYEYVFSLIAKTPKPKVEAAILK